MAFDFLFEAMAQMWGIGVTPAAWLTSLLFSLLVGIFLASKTRNSMIGLIGFMGTLFLFSFFGLFPLWILALPIILLITLYAKVGGKDDA